MRTNFKTSEVLIGYTAETILTVFEVAGIEIEPSVFDDKNLKTVKGFEHARVAIEECIEALKETQDYNEADFLQRLLYKFFYSKQEKAKHNLIRYNNSNKDKFDLADIMEEIRLLKDALAEKDEKIKQLEQRIEQLESKEESTSPSIEVPEIEGYEINVNNSIGIRNKKTGRVLKQYVSPNKGIYSMVKGKRVYIKYGINLVIENRLDQIAQSTIKIE